MPKVEMPRASWDSLLIMLEYVDQHHINWTMVQIMRKEIEDQVYSQEY